MPDEVFDIAVFGLTIATLLVALEGGYRLGVRSRPSENAAAMGQVGAIQGAALGLLGLLLGFSFAAAGTRFLERQDLIVKEANAIGTAYLRADLLRPPHDDALRGVLRSYTEERVRASARIHGAMPADYAALAARGHAEIWRAAVDGVAQRGDLAVAVLNPVNEVIDLHATRVAAASKRLPLLVLGLLAGCSLLAMGVIGYACGLGARRRLAMTAPLALSVAVALWITYDLDHPREGLIRLSDRPLQQLRFPEP